MESGERYFLQCVGWDARCLEPCANLVPCGGCCQVCPFIDPETRRKIHFIFRDTAMDIFREMFDLEVTVGTCFRLLTELEVWSYGLYPSVRLCCGQVLPTELGGTGDWIPLGTRAPEHSGVNGFAAVDN
jgi:hypothetical protein